MVKKLKKAAQKKTAAGANLLDSGLAGTVKDSAQQIWLAGLGAFSKAQQEGSKVFDALVKEGTALQRKTQAATQDKLGAVTDKMSSLADDMTAKANRQWGKLESLFEQRVSKALGKLGVTAPADIDTLVRRVDALSAQVDKLSKARTQRTPAGAKTAPVRAARKRT